MEPERSIAIGDHNIREYYWCGRTYIYVNRRLTHMNWEEAIEVANHVLSLAPTETV